MPKIKCPIDKCDYETPDISDIIVADIHSSICTVTITPSQKQRISQELLFRLKYPVKNGPLSCQDG